MRYKDPFKTQPHNENLMRQARVAQLTQLYAELGPLEVSPFDTASADFKEFAKEYHAHDSSEAN